MDLPSLARPIALASILAAASTCGGVVAIDGAATAEDELDASVTDASDDAGVDAEPAAPPQCLCPDAPGYAPCIKPFECCPVVGQCKDPAMFNCTRSSEGCP
jgi:hypothetical protein